jgi:hypothetical protein
MTTNTALAILSRKIRPRTADSYCKLEGRFIVKRVRRCS